MTVTDRTDARIPLKAATIEAAGQLAAHFDFGNAGRVTDVTLTPVPDAPTRFVAAGSPAALLNLLFLVSANGWVTDRSALDASLNLLTQVVR